MENTVEDERAAVTRYDGLIVAVIQVIAGSRVAAVCHERARPVFAECSVGFVQVVELSDHEPITKKSVTKSVQAPDAALAQELPDQLEIWFFRRLLS